MWTTGTLVLSPSSTPSTNGSSTRNCAHSQGGCIAWIKDDHVQGLACLYNLVTWAEKLRAGILTAIWWQPKRRSGSPGCRWSSCRASGPTLRTTITRWGSAILCLHMQTSTTATSHPWLVIHGIFQEYYRRIEAKMAEEELGIRGKREPPKLTTPYITKTDSYTPGFHYHNIYTVLILQLH